MREFCCNRWNEVTVSRAELVELTLSEIDLTELELQHRNARLQLQSVELWNCVIDVKAIATLLSDCQSLRAFYYNAEWDYGSPDQRRRLERFDSYGILRTLPIHRETLEFLALLLDVRYGDAVPRTLKLDCSLTLFSKLKTLRTDYLVFAHEPEDALVQKLPESLEAVELASYIDPIKSILPLLRVLASAGRQRFPNLKLVIVIGWDLIMRHNWNDLRTSFAAWDVEFHYYDGNEATFVWDWKLIRDVDLNAEQNSLMFEGISNQNFQTF